MVKVEALEERKLLSVGQIQVINVDTRKVIDNFNNKSEIVVDLKKTPNITLKVQGDKNTDRIIFEVLNKKGKFEVFATEKQLPYVIAGGNYNKWKVGTGQTVVRITEKDRTHKGGKLVTDDVRVITINFVKGSQSKPTTPTKPENPPTQPQQPENPPKPPTQPEQQPTPPTQPEYPTTPDSKPPINGNWVLTFVDEFNGTSLSSKWTPQYWWWDGDTGDNGELQRYDKSALSVKDGILYITATKESGRAKFDGRTYQYKSGLLTTGGSENGHKPGYNFTYGYVEARIKVPSGKGLWSAFWMLPQSYDDGRGEIDIMEVLGDATNMLETHYHVDGPGDADKATKVVDLAGDFHTYGVNWQKDSITWYLDGKAVFTAPNKTNEPMYLLLNLAVGGDWPGAPNSQTKFPSSMQVDYVKVWQNK